MIRKKYFYILFLLLVIQCIFLAGCSHQSNSASEEKATSASRQSESSARQKKAGSGKKESKKKAGQASGSVMNNKTKQNGNENDSDIINSNDDTNDSGISNDSGNARDNRNTNDNSATKSYSKSAGNDGTKEGKQTNRILVSKISFKPQWKYADKSRIHTGTAFLYEQNKEDKNGKDFTVCINAGHGTKGGSSVQTLCHPDGSAKVTSGTTKKGAVKSTAISEGMTFPDGTSEADANLALAKILKEKLLEEGYNVLMIRESEDVQLDNIARTLIANNYADCHISIHYDSTESDKGIFFLSVPNNQSYRSMEPVRSYWKAHMKLGTAIVEGIEDEGLKLFNNGSMEMDLTQTSYSMIPSIDLEVGDAASDISKDMQTRVADGILKGLDKYIR